MSETCFLTHFYNRLPKILGHCKICPTFLGQHKFSRISKLPNFRPNLPKKLGLNLGLSILKVLKIWQHCTTKCKPHLRMAYTLQTMGADIFSVVASFFGFLDSFAQKATCVFFKNALENQLRNVNLTELASCDLGVNFIENVNLSSIKQVLKFECIHRKIRSPFVCIVFC